ACGATGVPHDPGGPGPLTGSGSAVDARSVRRLELDLEPHRRHAERQFLRLRDEGRTEVVPQVVGRACVSRRLLIATRGRYERQPEGPREREQRRLLKVARVAVDAAPASGQE